MNSFADNTYPILKKWESEGNRLAVRLNGGWFSLKFDACVAGASEDAVTLSWGDGELTLLLRDASIKYSEPREISSTAPSGLRESAERMFESMLSISLSSGMELILAAYRDE
jgi:hypothetical protein